MAFGFLKRKKNKKSENSDSRYLNLKVHEVVRETKDAVSLVFEQPGSALAYKAGQFVTVILTIDGKKIRRAYSLCSSPYSGELPAITIKRVEDGIMSNYINDNVKAGDTIEVMEPMGSFTPEINTAHEKHYVLVGGGSGITPLMSIAKSVMLEEAKSKVSLIYANQDESSIIFSDGLTTLKQEYNGRLTVEHFLENPPEKWDGHQGWLQAATLKEVINGLGDPSHDSMVFYTCGPEPMMNIVMDALAEMNVPEERRFKESFVAGNTSPKEIIATDNGQASEGREVTIILDGDEHKFTVKPNSTILETGLDQNIDMPYSCQSGLCTACRGKCLSGTVKMDEDDGLSDEEKAEGYVLLCVGHPETDDVVVEIG